MKCQVIEALNKNYLSSQYVLGLKASNIFLRDLTHKKINNRFSVVLGSGAETQFELRHHFYSFPIYPPIASVLLIAQQLWLLCFD